MDKESEEYRLINPIVSLLKSNKPAKKAVIQQFEEVDNVSIECIIIILFKVHF